MLALSGISHAFVADRPVLSDVSLALAPGELVGVLGPNGAGKSTLAHIALGLLAPQAGTVRLDDQPLLVLPHSVRALRLSAVLQSENTGFGFSVQEVVMLGRHPHRAAFAPPSPADAAAVSDALARIDAQALAERRMDTLSGGERQRVLVARALAQATPFIVFDEPTTHFDLAHAHAFGALLASLRDAGKGILWILHDPNLALRFCDRVCLLQAGRVVHFGAAAAALAPEHIRQVFGVGAEWATDARGARHLLLG